MINIETNNSLWCPYGKRKTWQKSWRIDWVYGYQLFCHLGNKTEALDDILSSLCFVEGDDKKNSHKSANHNGGNSFLKLHYHSWNTMLSQDFSSTFKQTRKIKLVTLSLNSSSKVWPHFSLSISQLVYCTQWFYLVVVPRFNGLSDGTLMLK